MPDRINIDRAEWNLVPKTKFLLVEGTLVTKIGDRVMAEKAVPQGFNPNILLINLKIDKTNRLDVPFATDFPVPFSFRSMTMGNENLEQVQVVFENESETAEITRIEPDEEVIGISIQKLLGKQLRLNPPDNKLSDDLSKNEIIIRTDSENLIKSICICSGDGGLNGGG